MYKLQNQSIKRLSDGASIPMADGNRDYEEYKQWLLDGGTPEPEFTDEEIAIQTQKKFASILSIYLNTKAQEKGYDTIHTASLRAALVDSPFHLEGVAYGVWMDKCNAKGYEILAQVKAGIIPIPTEEEFITMLPVLVLP